MRACPMADIYEFGRTILEGISMRNFSGVAPMQMRDPGFYSPWTRGCRKELWFRPLLGGDALIAPTPGET